MTMGLLPGLTSRGCNGINAQRCPRCVAQPVVVCYFDITSLDKEVNKRRSSRSKL